MASDTAGPAPDEQVAVVGEYYRNHRGDVIHLAPCSRMGNALRWLYADGRPLRSIVAEVRANPWMRLCRRCWPVAALAEAEGEGKQ